MDNVITGRDAALGTAKPVAVARPWETTVPPATKRLKAKPAKAPKGKDAPRRFQDVRSTKIDWNRRIGTIVIDAAHHRRWQIVGRETKSVPYTRPDGTTAFVRRVFVTARDITVHDRGTLAVHMLPRDVVG